MSGADSVSRPREPTLEGLRNPLARYVAATRPAFLTASLMAGIVGLASAHAGGIEIDFITAIVTLLFAMLAQAGTNVLNDYYDALNGTDAQNVERVFPFTGGSRFIQNSVLTAAQMRNFGFALMLAVVLAGLWLMAYSAPQLFYVGLSGLFIGWAYSATPLKLNSRGYGELCVAAGFLLIVIGADYVQRKGASMQPVVAGLPFALLAMNLLYINQFPDRSADIGAGKLHWVARLDVSKARWGYALVAALAYAWLLAAVALGMLPLLALLGLLAAPLSAKAAMRLLRHAGEPWKLGDAIKLTIAAMLAHGALVSTGLILG